MDASRPRPAPEGGDASGVDLDDMDLAAGRALGPAGSGVGQRLVDASGGIGGGEDEADAPGKQERQRPPAFADRSDEAAPHRQNFRLTPSRSRWRSES
jgi:hypothetical protein